MKITGLHIRNFLTIGEAKLNLADQGLVLIQGENRDDESASSNGSGKSSIPDALCWALYGTTARGEGGDAVINATAKKNCIVTVTLVDGDRIYTVTRHRKHATHKNGTLVEVSTKDEPDARVDLSRGTEKETQLVINDVMGCTYEVFMAAIYAGQEAMPDLPKLTDKQLKLLIEEAAGVERLEVAYNIARSKMAEAGTARDFASSGVTSAEATIVRHTARMMELSDLSTRFFAERPLEEARYKDEARKIADEMKVIFGNYKRLNVDSAVEERAKILAGFAAKDAANAAFNEASRVVNETRSDAKAQAYEVSRDLSDLNAITHHIKNARVAMAKPCSECGKPHTPDELEEFVAHAKTKLVKAKAKCDASKAVLAELEAIQLKAERDAEAAQALIPDVTAELAREATLRLVVEAGDTLKRQLSNRKVQHDEILKKAAATLTANDPYKALLEKAAVEAKALNLAFDEARAAMLAREEELAIAEKVTQVFSPAGVRAHILDTVTPFLNVRTSEYLSALSEGHMSAVWSTLADTAKGDTREKFNIAVSNDKGAKSFGGLSGGEKRKVRLATMLALQDLVATRATKPIALWVGDEIDDALDPAGLERLMGILETKARERGTVLIISHNSLSDWVDNICTVVKEGGKSTVSGVLT